jgi:hypothetical protein
MESVDWITFEKGEWPEQGTRVLVTVNGYKPYVAIKYWTLIDGQIVWQGDGPDIPNKNVEAWSPLPHPFDC